MTLKGTIIFSSGKKGNYDIWRLDLESSRLKQLTHGTDWNDCPRFSPDGQKILFTSNRTGSQEIWIMDEEGSHQEPLTASGKAHFTPSWHPEGDTITFCAAYSDNLDVYTMGLDGKNLTQITNYEGPDSMPRFSPDGTKIVFTSRRCGNDDIWEYDSEKNTLTQLTTHVAQDFSPVYSPDGEKIAFVSGRYLQGGDPNLDIFIMNCDGSGQVRMTVNRGIDRFVTFSPDGRHLLYTAAQFSTVAERMQVISLHQEKKETVRVARGELEKEIDSEPFSIFFIPFPGAREKGITLDSFLMGEGLLARSPLGKLYQGLIRRTYPRHFFGTERYPDWKF